MSNLLQAIWVELLKARRSKVPVLTALGFALAPLAGGVFMIVLNDPDRARRLGIISTKAQIVAGSGEWPTYLGFLAQATTIGGLLLFSLIGTWVFGREYADRTITDVLALPTPRGAIVLAKFMVVLLWSATLTAVIYGIGLAVGTAIRLPPVSAETFWQATVTMAIAACLTMALVPPIAFVASVGHGYLAPMGAAILLVIMAQILAAAGWGDYFPWSVPALYAGMAGPAYAQLGWVSYGIVGLTSLTGMLGTFVWWEWADHT